MKKKFLIVGVLAIISIFALNAYAAEKDSSTHESGTGLEKPEVEVEDQGVGQQDVQAEEPQDDVENGVQAQNENKIQNQGEDNQIQNEEQQGGQNDQKTKPESGSTVSAQRRSAVANAVQEMLQVADRNGGIGQEVKTIAQAQNQNQEKIEASLTKVQSRSGFAKFLIGPNYGEIKNAEKLLEQNREQIKQLNEIKSQLTNQGDEQTLATQIQTLEQANSEIENSLTKEKGGFSLFGWLFD